MLRRVTSIVVIVILMVSGASAAHLSDIQGSVLVNNQVVAANIELVPGDRVRVVSGSVKIVYNNCSTVNISPGQTAVVLSNAPACPADVGAEAAPAPAPAVDIGIGRLTDTGTSTAYIVAGAAVAGGAALAIALSQSGNSPASP